MITPQQEKTLWEQFNSLGRMETLLLGRYQGSKSVKLATKISTGYVPGFEIAGFAHCGDEAAMKRLVTDAKKTSWSLEV